MDGHFVPNLTFGPVIVKWLRPVTRLPLEVHLMIDNPDQFLEAFAEAGANTLIVHQEGAIHLNRTVQQIKGLGRAGVAINPATPAGMLEEILPDLDLVLVMTVNPGFGGQRFLAGTLPKIRTIRQMIDSLGTNCELEVDGGIDHKTAPLVVEAGARVLVAGFSIYGATDGVAAAMDRLATLGASGKVAEPVAGRQEHGPAYARFTVELQRASRGAFSFTRLGKEEFTAISPYAGLNVL